MTTITLRALNRATLARQLLLERAALDARTAIERLAGLQAQVPKPPFLALWSRLANFEPGELRKLYASRKIVRGTLMRGTLHTVTRDDFHAWRPILQPVLAKAVENLIKDEQLDVDAVLNEARKLLGQSPHVFEDIRQHLVARFPDRNDRLLGYTVRMYLPLIMVPDDSPWSFPTNAAFALEPLQKTTATAHDLVLRYLAAFGPATPADFQTWSGLTGARAWFDELRPRLVTLRDEKKRELFDLPDAPRPDEDVDAPVRLLPEFDTLLLAHADRARVIADAHRPRIATKNLRIPATFLVDGFIAGMWSLEKNKLVLDPFVKLTKKVQSALDEEGERLGVRWQSHRSGSSAAALPPHS